MTLWERRRRDNVKADQSEDKAEDNFEVVMCTKDKAQRMLEGLAISRVQDDVQAATGADRILNLERAAPSCLEACYPETIASTSSLEREYAAP